MGDINFLSDKKEGEATSSSKQPRAAAQVEFHLPHGRRNTSSDSSEKKAKGKLSGLISLLRRTTDKLRKSVFVPRKKHKLKPQHEAPEGRQLSRPDLAHAKVRNIPGQPGPALVRGKNPGQPASAEKKMSTGEVKGEVSEGPPGIDVNLIPWQDPQIKRTRLFKSGLIIFSILIVIIWAVLVRVKNVGQESKITGLQDAIADLDGQLSSIDTTLLSEGSGIALRQRKLVAILENMPRWSKFIEWLERSTDPQIYYSSLSVNPGGEIRIAASAQDFSAVARQWVAFQSDKNWVKNVEILGITKASGLGQEDQEEAEEIVVPETTAEVLFDIVIELNTAQLKEDLSVESF